MSVNGRDQVAIAIQPYDTLCIQTHQSFPQKLFLFAMTKQNLTAYEINTESAMSSSKADITKLATCMVPYQSSIGAVQAANGFELYGFSKENIFKSHFDVYKKSFTLQPSSANTTSYVPTFPVLLLGDVLVLYAKATPSVALYHVKTKEMITITTPPTLRVFHMDQQRAIFVNAQKHEFYVLYVQSSNMKDSKVC
jgi:hypothetical protein